MEYNEENEYRYHKDDLIQDSLNDTGNSSQGAQNTQSTQNFEQGTQNAQQNSGWQQSSENTQQSTGNSEQGSYSYREQNTGSEQNTYSQQNSYNGQAQNSQWSQNGQSTEQHTAYYTPYDDQNGKRKKKEKKVKEPRQHKGIGKFIGKVTAAALIFGMISSLTFTGTSYLTEKVTGRSNAVIGEIEKADSNDTTYASESVSTTTSNVVNATALDVSDVVEATMPSIVQITCITDVNYFGMVTEADSAGSGIIVAESGDYIYIATNNHVVDGANSVSVVFTDDTSVEAEVKGTDPDNDLAVVTVKKSDVPDETYSQIKVASIGDSSELKVGQTAIAIGNALGYGQSVTTGVISALNREVTIDDVTNELIQTDAAINPGNSGGALINAAGEVIGINSAKYSDTSVEGMGYAIPIDTAMPIIEDLIEREVVDESKSAYLGVAGQDVTSDIAKMYNMPEGLYVTRVMEGSAAEKYGIQQGDIITSFDGHSISSMEGLQDLMQYYAAGTTVDIGVQRNVDGTYSEVTVTVTLGKKAS